jgi:gliding motility-associated lipoprotein GldD
MKCSIIAFFLILTFACNSGYQPKPSGYFKINLPKERKYIPFNSNNYPYTFEYASDATIDNDSTVFAETTKNDYWLNVSYPAFNCKVYISYNKVTGLSNYKVKDGAGNYKDSIGKNSFDKLRNDAFNLTGKHIYKSSQIVDEKIKSNNNISGMVFKVGGDAASPIQFFLSDTTTHFLRGALYYDAQPKQDSTKPVTEFIYKDIQHLINTLRWK